jgi:hypothetical protein
MLYEPVLGRTPGDAETRYWAQLLDARPFLDVEAAIVASDEARADAGDDAGWVILAYRHFLGRYIDNGAAYWVGQLANRSRYDVARAISSSNESREHWVDLSFRRVLDRDVDPGGRAYWAQRLNTGLDRLDLAAYLQASDEAFGSG